MAAAGLSGTGLLLQDRRLSFQLLLFQAAGRSFLPGRVDLLFDPFQLFLNTLIFQLRILKGLCGLLQIPLGDDAALLQLFQLSEDLLHLHQKDMDLIFFQRLPLLQVFFRLFRLPLQRPQLLFQF